MVTQLPVSSAAWSARLLFELDDIDRSVDELTSRLTAEQLNWRAAPGTWSIGQCLEHLCLFSEIYLPAISAALVEKSASAVEELKFGWFARWFTRNFVDPSPSGKRASAPNKIVPGLRVELAVIDRLRRRNQEARELIRKAGQYDVNRIRFRNPFMPLVRFTVGTGLYIICGHERRHLLQAQHVKQAAAFPCS